MNISHPIRTEDLDELAIDARQKRIGRYYGKWCAQVRGSNNRLIASLNGYTSKAKAIAAAQAFVEQGKVDLVMRAMDEEGEFDDSPIPF